MIVEGISMYTINERPTLEVELSADSKIYLKNIDVIISEQYVDRIIIKSEEKTERIKEYLQSLIQKYENKEFYLCNLLDMNLQNQNVVNCFDFTINSIDKKPACNLGMLHIDLSDDLTEETKKRLEDLLSDELFTCIAYFEGNHSLSGLDYQKWLNYLTTIRHQAKLYLSNTFISVNNIVQHPCNAYLCAGNRCHSGKSNCPRYLYVTPNGIYPYKCMDDSLNMCENIYSQDISDYGEYINTHYLGTDKYNHFIEINKKIYFDYILGRQWEVLEWNIFMQKILKDR